MCVQVFTAAATAVAEVGHPSNVLLTVLRAQLVMLQGVWFCQIAQILYRGESYGAADCLPSQGPLQLLFCGERVVQERTATTEVMPDPRPVCLQIMRRGILPTWAAACLCQ